jgi:[ribosomal protein S5]-alanine N-acetyltransferase
VELQTERLKLIPCTEQFVSSMMDEYDLGPYIQMYLEKLKSDPALLGWGVWFVVEKETNQVIGDIGFKGKPNAENTVEVGYGIKSSKQNKGYATEAVSKIIQWAFSFENVKKVIAECLVDNYPSIRVLEKLNMKKVDQENNMLKWELYRAAEQ